MRRKNGRFPAAFAETAFTVAALTAVFTAAAAASLSGMTAFAQESGTRVIGPGGTGAEAVGPGAAGAEKIGPGAAGAEKINPGTAGADASNGLGIVLEDLDASAEASRLVVVVGSGMDSSRVKVGYYTKSEDGAWSEQFCVDGYCGYNGMSADKQEGDRRTPTGTYSFTRAFGSLQDPGSILPYKQLDQYDYWVDDSNSAHYNQMVSTKTVEKDWNSAEHLIGVMPQYRYSLALSYNTAERQPGKGSAIFLHGYHTWKTWTEGCIAIPEADMCRLVQQVDADTRIVILPRQPEAVLEQQPQ